MDIQVENGCGIGIYRFLGRDKKREPFQKSSAFEKGKGGDTLSKGMAGRALVGVRSANWAVIRYCWRLIKQLLNQAQQGGDEIQ